MPSGRGVAAEASVKSSKTQEFEWSRLILPVAFLGLAIFAYSSGLTQYLTFKKLREHRELLKQWVEDNPTIAPLSYVSLFVFIVSCSLPGATMLALCSGFLFKQPWSTMYAVFGAATGAVIIFSVARTSFGEYLRNRVRGTSGVSGNLFKRLEAGLKEHEALYLLLVRLVPVFPFFFVNIVPSILGVKPRTFAWTTYLAICPGSFVYTTIGRGLAEALDADVEDVEGITFIGLLRKGLVRGDVLTSLCVLGTWLLFLLCLRFYFGRRKRSKKALAGGRE